MSTRGAYPVRSNVVEHRMLVSRWLGGGSGNPTLVAGRGVVSITRNGTGDFSAVLDETFGVYLMATVDVESASARKGQVATYTAATKTLAFKTYDLATPTVQDVSATNEWITIVVHYADSGITQ